jgi:hypothetical protein
MTSQSPAARFLDGTVTSCTAFSAQLTSALYLDALIAGFGQAIALEGGIGHACFGVDGQDRKLLLGSPASPAERTSANGPRLILPIRSWDENEYELEVEFANPEWCVLTPSLHAIATLYVARAIALLGAGEDEEVAELTANEQRSVRQREAGLCNLDIADDLGRSPHAVAVYLERAARKLQRC